MKRKIKILLASAVLLSALAGACVVFVSAPPSLAMWLIDEHVDFFEKPYPEWAADKSIIDRLIVRAVAYKLSRDWVTRSARAVKSKQPSGLGETVVAARDQLNSTYVNQRQIWHPPIDLPTYARLIYGMAWCDGQNHLFSMILAELLGEAYTFALYDQEIRESVHVAVQLNIDGVPIIADAWSDVPVFVMDENRKASNADVPLWLEVSENIILQRMERAAMDRTAMAQQYFADGDQGIRSAAQPVAYRFFDVWSDMGRSPKKEGSGFQFYLKARVYHLLGHKVTARNYYLAALEAPSTDALIHEAATWFLNKLQAGADS